MKITYTGQSGFVIEWDSCFWIFDFAGSRADDSISRGQLPSLPQEKEGFVFVSHKHYDHFSYEIFGLRDSFHKINYILDRGIPVRRSIREKYGMSQEETDGILRVRAGEKYSLRDPAGNEIRIHALRSTDCGVAYLLEYCGKTVYHAGDLNWWIWEEESDQYNQNMTRNFKEFTLPLEGRRIDLAFLPLDYRQGEDYARGFDYIMKIADVKTAFPMHLWKDFSIIDRLLLDPCSREYRERIVKINCVNESWIL